MRQQVAEQGHRFQAALAAQMLIPVIADFHMADFVAVNDVQNTACFRIAALRHFGAYAGRNVQTARFQHPGYQRHPQQGVESRFVGHVP